MKLYNLQIPVKLFESQSHSTLPTTVNAYIEQLHRVLKKEGARRGEAGGGEAAWVKSIVLCFLLNFIAFYIPYVVHHVNCRLVPVLLLS